MPALSTAPARPRRVRLLLGLLAVLAGLAIAAALLFPILGRNLVAQRVRATAAARGLDASWSRLDVGWTGRARLADLVLVAADGDTALRAAAVELTVAPRSVLAGSPRLTAIHVRDARVRRESAADDADSVAATTTSRDRRARRERERGERARRFRRVVDQAVRTLFVPARDLPSVTLERVTLENGGESALVRAVALDRLDLRQEPARTVLELEGTLSNERDVRFAATMTYGRDDQLGASGRIVFPAGRTARGRAAAAPETLALDLEGVVVQDRRGGELSLKEGTRARIGALPLALAGSVERRGPRFRFDLAADAVDERQVHASLPASMLGPLPDVAVRGTFDYRLHFDLDIAAPEQVDFRADVIPHDLRLDGSRTRVPLHALDGPFVATIRLPRGRVVTRALTEANPRFKRLDELEPHLVHAVVTNEDGAFFRHRGFNLDAVKESIAENIAAGAYRRGAGTITMQLARNLFLGHERTLSRKMQEVVLAWVLEHLTPVSKERLLEIYLNVIEWGPGIHGADEAAEFYFGRSAKRLSVDEALFLAILVPAPSQWKWKFDDEGALRGFAREQMHFIGRAMIAKGWLDADRLPPVDELRVELRGPARALRYPEPPADDEKDRDERRRPRIVEV
jgi:hypothetical protein